MALFSENLFAAGEAAAAAQQPSMIESMVPFLLIFAVMYFIIIRPQAKKAKAHETLMDALKPGDEVVTSGGIIGRIKSITPDFVAVDAGSTVLKVKKNHISALTQAKAPAPAKASKKS